jgi:hypothetical protein
MSLIDYVLGQQNIQQLDPKVQDQARSEGYRRFILGSLLGGRGLASGYAAAQEVIPGIQAAEQQRQMRGAVQRSMVLTDPTNLGITQAGPGSQLDILNQENAQFGNDPVVGQRTVQALQSNPNLPRRFDPNLYLQNMTPLVATDPTKALPLIQAGAPKFDSATGLFTNPLTGQIISSVERPGSAAGTATRLDTTGQMNIRAIPGAAQAAEVSAPVALRPNQIIAGYDANKMPIVANAPGSVAATSQMAGAERLATGMAEAQTDLVEVQGADGTKYRVPRASLLGTQPAAATPGQAPRVGQAPPVSGVSAVSPAQTALNESYKPILESARSGFEVAKKRSGTIEQLRNALNNPNFDTGALTPFKSNMTNVLSSFGVTGDRANSYLTSSAAFRQGVNELTMSSLADLVGAISNFEIDFSQKRFGTITDPKQANLYSLDLLEAADKRRREYYDFVTKNPDPLVEQKWAESQAGQRSLFEDPKLRKWLPKATIPSGPDKGKIAYQLPNGKTVVFD